MKHCLLPALCALGIACSVAIVGCGTGQGDAGQEQGCRQYAEPVPKGLLPERLEEISGLAMSRTPGVLWMHNDSGGGPYIYAVDTDSGALLATVTVENDVTYDWEDMSAGPCAANRGNRCLYIGDIGDGGLREFLNVPPRIHRIAEPDPAGGDQTVTDVETMLIRYPDGIAHNAEAMVADGQGRIFILTKEKDNHFWLFGAPFEPGDTPTELTVYGDFDISSMHDGDATKVTAADFSIEDNRLIVRGWTGILEYILPSGHDLTSLQGVVPRVVPHGDEEQGEAVVYGDGGYYHVSEGERPPVYFVACDDEP